MRADKYLLLNWKRILLIIGAWVLAVILHNLIYGLFQSYFASGGDEPFFFILAVIVIPLYAVVALVYTIIRLLTRRR